MYAPIIKISRGTNKNLYSGYFAWYCVQQKYLRDVPCKFKGFIELVKHAYRLDPALETTRKKLRVAEPEPNQQPKNRKLVFPQIINLNDDDDFV